jgi:hypothetical protein
MFTYHSKENIRMIYMINEILASDIQIQFVVAD